MLNSITSDIRKLITIRSTYFITIVSMVIVALLSFYAEGWKGSTGSPASLATDRAIEVVVTQSSIVVIFLSVISILHMAHEYRYNTIMYTLTANVSRTKVLLSKIISVSIVSLVFGTLLIAFSVACYLAGLQIRDVSLPAQSIDILHTVAKLAFYFLGYALIGLFIAVIIKGLVGAVAFFLIVPSTLESLLQAFWLKDNAVYLPFKALDGVIRVNLSNTQPPNVLSAPESALVAFAYVIGIGIVAWILFIKRDAN